MLTNYFARRSSVPHCSQMSYLASEGGKMKPFRVLLISNVRPSRSWNFANRITLEIPGTTICGIVQRPLRSVPAIQKLLAKHEIPKTVPQGWLSKTILFFQSIPKQLVGWLLWFIHGCPIDLNNQGRVTISKLMKECARKGWPLLVTLDPNLPNAPNSIRHDPIDLVILLGEFPSVLNPPLNSSNGCIRASCRTHEGRPAGPQNSTLVRIERLTRDSETPATIASVSLPWQKLDGLLGFTLKTDLIADDLFRKFPSRPRKTVNSPSSVAPAGSSVWIHSCFAHRGFSFETGTTAVGSNIRS